MKISAIPALTGFFIKTRVLRKEVPLIASFKLTYRCNLRCAACPFHLMAEGPNPQISWETAVDAMLRLRKAGCLLVVFEGGEPLLWRDKGHDFNDIVRFAEKHFIAVGATTNGTLPLDAGTDVLWVSLDGLKETHDRLRSGSFETAVSNISRSSHRKLFVHFTFNRNNYKEFEDLALYATGMPQVKGITVQFFYPYGSGEEDLSLSPDERRKAVETAIRLKKSGVPIMNSSPMLRAMIDNSWKCRAWLLANVEPDGNVFYGCYAKGRGELDCKACGFTPVAEASGAYNFFPKSLFSGLSIFLT